MKKSCLFLLSLVLSSFVALSGDNISESDLNFLKSFTLGELHNLESESSEGKCEIVSKWGKYCSLSRDFLQQAFDKCHSKTQQDLFVADRLKQITSVLYGYTLDLSYDGYSQCNREGKTVYPFRSSIAHMVRAMLTGEIAKKCEVADRGTIKSIIFPNINGFCDVWQAIEIEAMNRDVRVFEKDKVKDFVQVCSTVADQGGFNIVPGPDPVSLAEFVPLFLPSPASTINSRLNLKSPVQNSINKLIKEDDIKVINKTPQGSWLKTFLKVGLMVGGVTFVGLFGKNVYDRYDVLYKGKKDGKGRLGFLIQAIKDVSASCYGGTSGWLKKKLQGAMKWLGYGTGEIEGDIDIEALDKTIDEEKKENQFEIVHNGKPAPEQNNDVNGVLVVEEAKKTDNKKEEKQEDDRGFVQKCKDGVVKLVENTGVNAGEKAMDKGLKRLDKYEKKLEDFWEGVKHYAGAPGRGCKKVKDAVWDAGAWLLGGKADPNDDELAYLEKFDNGWF